MSVLLEEALTEARELRAAAEAEFRRAIVRAADGGMSYRAISRVAGITFSVVGYHVRRMREESRK